MSEALYRKYRPQTFKEVVGQNHVKITLQNEILAGQIAHAYLFTGPRGIGKTSLARIMAKALNCTQRKEKEFEPCNECDSCTSTTAGKNLDLIEMDAATHTQVDKVRENIIENVRFSPHGSKYKVFIIDEVHMLSTAAFNALLKTLEEPPEYVVFILCTTEAYKLPETIISRCQRFDFKKVSAEAILKKLKNIVGWEKLNIDEKVLETIAFRSGGFIRDAESLLNQIVSLSVDNKDKIKLEDIEPILPRSDLDSIAELVDALIANNTKAGIETINGLVSDGVDVERFNLDLVDYLRKIILIKTGLKDQDYSLMGLPEKIESKIVKQAEQISLEKLVKILEKFMSAQYALKEAEITQLPLEMAVIEITESTRSTKNTESTPMATAVPKNKVSEPLKPLKPLNNKEEGKLETKPVDKTSSRGNINPGEIKKIQNIWPEFIKQIQEVNHSLPVILQNAHPISLNKDLLELGFGFELHVKRMSEQKCLSAAEEVLEKILGSKIKIKPILLTKEQLVDLKPADTPVPTSESNNSVAEVLDVFGGKIIE